MLKLIASNVDLKGVPQSPAFQSTFTACFSRTQANLSSVMFRGCGGYEFDWEKLSEVQS